VPNPQGRDTEGMMEAKPMLSVPVDSNFTKLKKEQQVKATQQMSCIVNTCRSDMFG